MKIKVFTYNTVIVGSGASSLNGADCLYKNGQKSICIITEGFNMGTSRNTGSDKQTYYKQSTSASDNDSPVKMAKTLFNGGAMHGDIALVEAILSLKCFYKLESIGVPFPHDKYGQYVGYKTDHDENKRASSIGPLTSKVMTEQLEEEVKKNNIHIFDKYLVIDILTYNNKSIGLLAMNIHEKEEDRFIIFNSTNIIYGTGGPASIYSKSVYPKNHFGASGIPILNGVITQNFTEWQYGLASIKFPWNLSGTYQQVLPRYISTDQNGNDEREFLEDFFTDKRQLLRNIFLKGYQWPFDPRKLEGSSIIDLLVYNETQNKGRRVFLDYSKNPKSLMNQGNINFEILDDESYAYLSNSNSLLDTPIKRLEKMNISAINLYKNHNIDIYKEYLEIDVCSQHQNGGIKGNIWWESSLKHFFVVGEVCGTLGVYRPGGTALNSGQVGSARAAQFISKAYKDDPINLKDFYNKTYEKVENKISFINKIKIGNKTNIQKVANHCQSLMTKNAAFIREKESIKESIAQIEKVFNNFIELVEIENESFLPSVMRTYDMLISQLSLLNSIYEYINKGGDSRGSYLIVNSKGNFNFKYETLDINYGLENTFSNLICENKCNFKNKELEFNSKWIKVREIPKIEGWFENVWNDFKEDNFWR